MGAATLLVFGLIYLLAVRNGDISDHLSLHNSAAKEKASNAWSHVTGDTPQRSQEISTQPQPTSFVAIDKQEQAVADDEALQRFLKALDEGKTTGDATQAPPADNSIQWSAPVTTSRVEYPFQEDLKLEFPFSALLEFKDSPPLHYSAAGLKTFAYSTFMATRNPSPNDPYFLAILSLTHRLLWSPRSRTTKPYPFIVFVADFVTQEQRDILAGSGAVVRELPPLEWHCDVLETQKRWVDLFAKLNMWAQTEFERLIFLDADAFPLENIDDMFDAAPYQHFIAEKMALDDLFSDGAHAAAPYIFAGVPQAPWNTTYPEINVGSMIFTPDTAMHQRLLQNYLKHDHYNCGMAEQAFLNWQFDLASAYPPTLLERKWGGMFPGQDEEGKLKVVHQKIWAQESGWMKMEWERGWSEMVGWYGGQEFVRERGMGIASR